MDDSLCIVHELMLASVVRGKLFHLHLPVGSTRLVWLVWLSISRSTGLLINLRTKTY